MCVFAKKVARGQIDS